MRTFSVLLLVCVGLLSASCGKSTSSTSNVCDTLGFTGGAANAAYATTGIFTVSPVATSALAAIIPLGNLNPPGHVYPTDHMYLNLTTSTAGANNVLAAGPATVVAMSQPAGTDYKVIFKMDTSFYYYYDHITPAGGLAVGSTVTAGQSVGTNSGLAAAVDFGVYNFNITPLAGILNTCLAQSQTYVDSPIKYYSGALQTSMYAKITAAGSKDGKFDYDKDGKLVGNWALNGHQSQEGAAYQLAFVYNVTTLALRVSVGGTLAGGAASYAVQGGAADFNTISMASGQVNYQLYPTTNGDTTVSGTQTAVLSVQMLSASQIKVEIFQGNLGTTGTFDGSAQVYDR